MAYDDSLAERVRSVLGGRNDVVEKKMFGGLTFMVRGNMCVGIIGPKLMVRVGTQQYREALSLPHALPMDFTGRPMDGYVYVAPEGVGSADDLAAWIERGLQFNATMPAK